MSTAESYLAERGVLIETFTSNGGEIDASPHCSKISERLNRDFDGVRLSKDWDAVKEILWFPVSISHGERVHWLARPLPIYKKMKFVAPVGSDGMPWVPQKTREVAKDIDKPIVISEGPVKGLALVQAGAYSISLQGVWGSTAPKKKAKPQKPPEEDVDADVDCDADVDWEEADKLKLHPELAHFDWDYRQVLLCFDADRLKNRNVRQAEIRLFCLLHSLGAEVYQLSTWPLEQGKGVDDYIATKAGTTWRNSARFLPGSWSRQRPFTKRSPVTISIRRKESCTGRRAILPSSRNSPERSPSRLE